MRRILMTAACSLLGLLILTGCHKDEVVDKPLMTNAPPPPPRPDKPTLSPSGGGGGASAAPQSGKGAP